MTTDGYVWALGLMSGTSLDGVDVGLIETDGERVRSFGPSLTVELAKVDRKVVKKATRKALRWNFDGPPPNVFAHAEEVVDRVHVEAVEAFADRFPDDFAKVEVVGYHGQTVLHRPPEPGQRRTVQLGRGHVLADRFGVPCVHDFRSNDMVHGGQGAPLAPVYHRALVGEREGLAVINLGGVGNVTVFAPEFLASDTGPANGPLDQWAKRHSERFDRDGRWSMEGTPDFARVERWLEGAFFRRPVPRSADRYDFDVLAEMSDMKKKNGAATLAAFAALGAARTIRDMDAGVERLVVCGGGRRNWAIVAMLREALGAEVVPAEAMGWDGDALEAQAFGFLAVRCLRGMPISYPGTTGVREAVSGGVVSWPRS